MKFILAAFLFVALCYQASAFTFESRALGRDYTCPSVIGFYEAVIECAEKLDTAKNQRQLCAEFRTGGCKDLTLIYGNDCGKNYGNDPVYRQLAPTMRQVKTLCF